MAFKRTIDYVQFWAMCMAHIRLKAEGKAFQRQLKIDGRLIKWDCREKHFLQRIFIEKERRGANCVIDQSIK
ncbi:hypothetical protein B14911_20588 [Bacillus sp. NRRL B-14911]|nr:hypothetical protein B14911_20588 [Bacillus sp. NRRL B-14911]PLR71817.1 hypothetical protein CYJ37_18275 [Bacillus sp. UMB0728]